MPNLCQKENAMTLLTARIPQTILWVLTLLLLPLGLAGAEEYDLYLLAGQSNMDGRGLTEDLTEAQLSGLENAIIYYRNVSIESEGWSPLQCGFSKPPKFKGGIPAPTFGPEIGFVQAISKAQPDRKIALIKGSKGGTNLRRDWVPGEKDNKESQGPCYANLSLIHI